MKFCVWVALETITSQVLCGNIRILNVIRILLNCYTIDSIEIDWQNFFYSISIK
jgi:hypothetical protein